MGRFTRKHGVCGIAYQKQTLTMPNWEWGAIEKFPELEVCGFSVFLLVIAVEMWNGVFGYVLHSGDQIWVEGLEFVEEIG